MADTFFDFSLKNGEHLLPDDEDECLENEEEYDALNNETFGDLEDDDGLDDWEQQHEQFAEFTKKHSDELEKSVRSLALDDLPKPLSLTEDSVWTYTPPQKENGDISILSSLQEASKSFLETRVDLTRNLDNSIFNFKPPNLPAPLVPTPAISKKICTVEELEKNLIKTVKNGPNPHSQPIGPPMPPQMVPNFPRPPMLPNQARHPIGPPPPMYPPHPMFPNHPMGPRFMPGMLPMNMPPPMRGHLPPPGFRMLPPHPFLQANGPQRPPPGIPFPYQVNPQMNMPPPNHMQRNHPPNNQIPLNHQQQWQQRQRSNQFRDYPGNHEMRDEYEGLMTMREKQWLMNIQLLQLNTGTPYFDDYYFTIFKEKKAKSNKENNPIEKPKFQNRQRRNSDRQENTLQPKAYTPQQFENSLGKLQCGSVTAPRKIIDMDVVSLEKESETPSVSKDSRKTKQLLLELEVFYSYVLKAEDLVNPLAISNLKTLRDIKQKQRLKELEAAETAEQKQEILELVKKESEPILENPNDFIMKVVAGLLQDEKFNSFFNIRKGKLLVLRLLPHLMNQLFYHQEVEIWSRILLSLPIVGRRDMAGDNILPRFYQLFKRYMQTVEMPDILENVSGLIEVIKPESNRSTPLSHQGRAPLYFVLLNKFGISAIAAMIIRSEFLLSSGEATENQQKHWFNFLTALSDLIGQVTKVPAPIEPIPQHILQKHCDRVPNFNAEKSVFLTKYFVVSH